MNRDLRIEHYLLQLERELKSVPVSQRAEIITEVKARLRAMDTPGRPIEEVFAEIGSPRAVARTYLQPRGLKVRRPFVKWLAIGTVVFFGLVCMTGLMVIKYLSPIAQIDRATGRVTLLGGYIDVNDELGQVKVGDMVVNEALRDGVTVNGEEDLRAIRAIKIPFNTAKLEVVNTDSRKLTWDCTAARDARPTVEVNAGVMTLNLDPLTLARCAISIPVGLATEIRGVNGHMDIEQPASAMDIRLDNGKVSIHPDPQRAYDFEVRVKNGLQDFFPRSSAKDAVKVKVNVMNGLVKKE